MTDAQIATRPTTPRPARRAYRPRVEPLEDRALQAASPLDPAFHGGAPVVNPVAGTTTSLNTAGAVAVQRDGRILVAGSANTSFATSSAVGSTLAVRRYNADGTLDTTFGIGGEADVALPAGTYNAVSTADKILIQPDGRIVVAATLSTYGVVALPTLTTVETVVVRLNSNGSPDASFGSAGTSIIGTYGAQLNHLALQSDGKILLAGTATLGLDQVDIAVDRLDADGNADLTFNGGGLLLLATSATPIGVFEAPGGRILVATSTGVEAFTPSGTIDTSYGIQGFAAIPGTSAPYTYNAAAIQPDGKLLVASNRIVRIDTDGSIDPSFAQPSLYSLANSLAVQPDGGIVAGFNFIGFKPVFDVVRFTSFGMVDARFGVPDLEIGVAGVASIAVPPSVTTIPIAPGYGVHALATTSTGGVVVAGTAAYYTLDSSRNLALAGSQLVLAVLRRTPSVAGSEGDYDGDNRSDFAAQLEDLGIFAVRRSTGGDALSVFGQIGTMATIPVSGDFDGDGKADVAGYLPSLGAFAYRPSSGGPDVLSYFGSAGAGASIPAVGDYDGDGKADMAVYLPAVGALAVRPSGGGPDALSYFGSAGAGASIPAIGDYDGDGKSDLAVYLPAYGALAVRPSGGGWNYIAAFGSIGAGASIPVPGDYDGDGKTDIAVYLPAFGLFAIKPSSFSYLDSRYFVPFGMPGATNTVPAPGDYDGDGKTDVAAYLPTLGLFAYRPSTGGGRDVVGPFGAAGPGATVPATSIPYAQPGTVGAAAFVAAAASQPGPGLVIPLTDDLLAEIAGAARKRRA